MLLFLWSCVCVRHVQVSSHPMSRCDPSPRPDLARLWTCASCRVGTSRPVPGVGPVTGGGPTAAQRWRSRRKRTTPWTSTPCLRSFIKWVPPRGTRLRAGEWRVHCFQPTTAAADVAARGEASPGHSQRQEHTGVTGWHGWLLSVVQRTASCPGEASHRAQQTEVSHYQNMI